MTARDTVRRMAEANPVPDTEHLHADPADADRLFSSIERRRDEMIRTTTRTTPSPAPPPPPRPWYRRPAVVLLIAIAAVIVVAVPLVFFTSGDPDVTETPATTAPVLEASTTLPPTTTPTTLPATTLSSETQPIEDDGYTWSEVSLQRGQFVQNETEIWGVTHTGSHFVAVGRVLSDCAQVWVSPDGAAWGGAPGAGGGVSVPCRAILHDVASNDLVSVAVGQKDDRPAIWISEDGYDWDLHRWQEAPSIEGDEIRSVAASELGFVAAGSSLWFSPDGQAWSTTTAPSVEWITDLAYGPDGYFAVGYLPKTVSLWGGQWASANAVLHSPDGQTWSAVAELDGSFNAGDECWVAGTAVTHGPAGYVIAGDCTSEDTNVAYSSMWKSDDGLTWSQVPHDEAAFGAPAHITSITADRSGYVAAGWTLYEHEGHSTVWTSEDGISWIRTELSGQGNYGIYGVAAYEGTAVAVGHSESQPAIWLGIRP